MERLPPHAKRVWGKSKEAAKEGLEIAHAMGDCKGDVQGGRQGGQR